MKKKISQLLLVGAAALVPAFGQGFYTTIQIDGGSFVQTDAIGYPGAGACGSESLYNAFNGDYLSGWAPTDLMSGTYGNDYTSYNWSYGFSYLYPSPYGYCIAARFDISQWIDYAHTTSRTPYQSLSGYQPGFIGPGCAQVTDLLSCQNTANAKYPVFWVAIGGVGLTCAECYDTTVINIAGVLRFGPASEAYGPRYCTPR